MPGMWSGVGAIGDEHQPPRVPEVRKHEGRQAALDRRGTVARHVDRRPRTGLIRSLRCSLRMPPSWLALARLGRSYGRNERHFDRTALALARFAGSAIYLKN